MTLQYGNYFAAVLPILFTFLLFVLFSQSFEWREAFLLSSVIWGTVVVLITEGLSLFNQLTYSSLTITWIIFDMLAGSILLNKVIRASFKPIRLQFPPLQRFEYFMITGILIIILTTGLIAMVAPPNSFQFDELSHEPNHALNSGSKRCPLSNQHHQAGQFDAGH